MEGVQIKSVHMEINHEYTKSYSRDLPKYPITGLSEGSACPFSEGSIHVLNIHRLLCLELVVLRGESVVWNLDCR